MNPIRELDTLTIDQIAAGEVVEKPLNVAKELVENAIDSGADAITVEIDGGGIGMLRVTDNGAGIPADEVKRAFFRHATSKLTTIDDLLSLHTLGFRGEALSSIAAVSRVEMITKTEEALSGIRYQIEGGREVFFEEVGAPKGSTVIVRDLFYNTPARAKFLRKPQTEGAHIAELMEHLALAHPEISFRFVNNHADRFHTAGNGDLKENIYRIYGRDIAASVIPFRVSADALVIEGYLGKPAINRGSRACELFYVNGRFIRDRMLSQALEEGYRAYLMQHRFPFAVLNLTLPPAEVDVNVHPSKLEVRFRRAFEISGFLTRSVRDTLSGREMIPDALLNEEEDRRAGYAFAERNEAERRSVPPTAWAEPFERDPAQFTEGISGSGSVENCVAETDLPLSESVLTEKPRQEVLAFGLQAEPVAMSDRAALTEAAGQEETPRFLSEAARRRYHILGQLFGTYWLIEYQDTLLIMDQHAAHEKVNYERLMRRFHDKSVLSQLLDPPVILNLTPGEELMVSRYAETFRGLGFELEEFGAHTIALRGIPLDLYGADNEQTFFLEILDELTEDTATDRDPKVVTARIANMACKASVKGNTRMTEAEVDALLDELLTLENPYHCPHGRPTLITMSRYEIDKKFKRIVGYRYGRSR